MSKKPGLRILQSLFLGGKSVFSLLLESFQLIQLLLLLNFLLRLIVLNVVEELSDLQLVVVEFDQVGLLERRQLLLG